MNLLRSFLPAALAVLALLAPAARADLRRYQCNVALAREIFIFGFTLPFDSLDGTNLPGSPEKLNYLFEFVIDDSVKDTDASTTKSTFPGAIVSGSFFGPLASGPAQLTTSTTATNFILTGSADFVIDAGAATINATFATPNASANFTVPFVGAQQLAIDTLQLPGLPVTVNDTGAGQTFKQQVTAPLAWSDLTFGLLSGANTIGAGTIGTAGSNDIRFFTLAETTVVIDGVLASPKAGVGSPVTDEPAGTTFAAFGTPSITPTGTIAATATLLKDRVRTAAIVRGPVGAVSVLLRAGDAAPGVTDGVFKSFGNIVQSDKNGRVAFLGRLKTGAGGVKATNDLGLWSNRTGTLTLLARKGDPAPGGIANATVVSLTDIAMDGNGEVFAGKVKGTGINATNDGVVWITRTAGTFVALRDGDTVPITGGGTKTIKSMLPLRAAIGTQGQGTALLSGNNFTGIQCLVKFTDGTSGLVFASQTDTTRTLSGQVVTGVDAPGLAVGQKLTKISLPSQSPATDRFAFRGTVGAKKDAIFNFSTTNQTFFNLAVVGTEVVDPGGFTVTKLGDPVVAEDGGVAWIGAIDGPGVTKANDSAICFEPFSGEVKAHIREGDEGPGIAGSKIKKFTGLALAQGAVERYYFTATLATGPGGVTAKTDTALWGGSPGNFKLLLREGKVLSLNGADRTVKSFTVFPRVRGSEIQRRAHATKRIVATVTCTDGTKGIVPLALP